jgi:hypothetical protein
MARACFSRFSPRASRLQRNRARKRIVEPFRHPPGSHWAFTLSAEHLQAKYPFAFHDVIKDATPDEHAEIAADFTDGVIKDTFEGVDIHDLGEFYAQRYLSFVHTELPLLRRELSRHISSNQHVLLFHRPISPDRAQVERIDLLMLLQAIHADSTAFVAPDTPCARALHGRRLRLLRPTISGDPSCSSSSGGRSGLGYIV